MNTYRRPIGRFFIALVTWLACMAAQRAIAADGAAIRPPAAPSGQLSAVSHQLSAESHLLRSVLPNLHAYLDSGMKLTRITDTVYRADGAKAKGELLISWPAFTTATGNAVAAGGVTVRLGADGAFDAQLAPTTGSTPTGVYYRVVYQIGDTPAKEEFWGVPATDTTTISAVRAKLVPTVQAAQFLSRDMADSIYVHAAGDQTVNGQKTFVQSPAVPTPANGTDAANKAYVDANAGSGANLDSPPPIGAIKPNTIAATAMSLAGGAGGDDTFNALRLEMQSSGQLLCDLVKKDGSRADLLHSCYLTPWFTPAPANGVFGQGVLGLSIPLQAWMFTGGPTLAGTSNTFEMPDPVGPICTVKPSAATGVPNGCSYWITDVDANSGVANPATCGNASCWAPEQLDSTHHNTVTWWQDQGPGHYGGSYSNALISRGHWPPNFADSQNLAINNSGSGVISKFSGCNAKGDAGNPPTDPSCSYDDDGSLPSTPLSELLGLFYPMPFRNTTADFRFAGRQWVLGAGSYLAGGLNIAGRVTTQAIGDPTPPSGSCNSCGSTQWQYVTVVHDFGLGVTKPSALLTIANGAETPDNNISWSYSFCNSVDVLGYSNGKYFTLAGGSGLPCRGTNTFGGFGSPNPYTFTDNNVARAVTNPSLQNTTADVAITGSETVAGTSTVGYGYATKNYSSPFVFGSDAMPAHGAIGLSTGDGGHTGTLNAYDPAGVRTFACGGDSNSDFTCSALAGGAMNVAAPLNATSIAVAGDLTMRDIPGHAYFVSKYPSIQAAINAAYGAGTVAGAVIDDRTTAYNGPGFYIPDSVTVRLAPVPYAFTSAATHNNGNNDVKAAIVVEQGAHLVGGGTSSNHGTTITVGSGFANDIIATTSVGTGTGAGVQWWHWGSIENLNLDGGNQTAGECVHVENMGETSKVRDLLVKNCYGNNVEFAGAAATQSDIANITSNRSRNGSGVRFSNLSGMGKINGLSGDCNAGALVSVQENAAGTLVITGLKAEAESSICPNGAAHDPVVLLDTMAGLNTHVHIVGGYAFGTAQNAVAKVVGAGGGIVEMEGFYVTGYTNLLNDTTRSVIIPATSTNSKQPFYYEPNGIVFANQAFTLTPGTGVMGGSTALTPIFYATTGNATMVASLGNGDGQSVMTGGVELAGQNRTNYGATPEVMARAGYRFTGSGYDTTKWDFIPAWNAGDTTEKNLGNTLTVCQKNGAVSCRWNHMYGVNVDALVFTLGTYTVATLPGSYGVGSLAWVNDGVSSSDCTAGHGSMRALCYYTGSAWTGLTTGGGGASWGSITGTLANQTDLQTALNGKAGSNASTTVNGVACALGASCATGMRLVPGTMTGPQGGVLGNGADQNLFSVTIPAGTVSVGSGLKCYARWTKSSSGNAVTYKWVLGGTTLATQAVGTSTSTNWLTELEIFTPTTLASEVASASPILAGTTIQSGPQVGLTASENLANVATLKLTFNASSAETVTPKVFYCTTVQ